MVAIKICGMTSSANIAAVAALCPDYLGFICWADSKRFIGEQLDAATLDSCGVRAQRVGVFVNQTAEEVRGFVKRLACSVIQLHGDESREFCCELRGALPGIEIWKMIPLADRFPAEEVSRYQGVVDRLLFDTRTPERGGSGVPFDWSLLSQYQSAAPLVLSGGLGVDNVARALAVEHPRLSVFDFNSKLESAPGMKDPNLVRQAITLIRGSSKSPLKDTPLKVGQ